MRDFGDAGVARQRIFDNVLDAASKLPPLENKRHILSLEGVGYQGPDKYSIAERKQAILEGRTLARRLRGTWVLRDRESQQELDRRPMTVAQVPYMTDDGTFVHNGTEYTLANQLRLRPGNFIRRKDNGEIEAHVNVMPGKGTSHRYYLDPAKGHFYATIGQANIPLINLMRVMGATDKDLQETWGMDLFRANMGKYSEPNVQKLYERFAGRKADPLASSPDKVRQLREIVEQMEFDPEVTSRTLDKPYKNLNLDALKAITKKLIAVSRGEADVDDRDHLAYQTVHGPEDLFAERLLKDYGGQRRMLFNRASWAGNLSKFPPGAFTRQLESALLGSGLGQCFDAETLVMTRRGWTAWPDVTNDDEFACLIDGQVQYRQARQVFRFDYDGELIGCRTKRFSYLVTPNHKCWVRARHRTSRGVVAGYAAATAEELYGKQRWHLTGFGALAETREPEQQQLCWKNDRWDHSESCEVAIEDWADFLGWWLAEGSAFIDGSSYTVTIAQKDGEHTAEIAELLDRMPFKWRRSSNGVDYVIRHKGLYEAMQACGVRAEKRIPRYVFSWSERLLRRLFDAFMKGDGSDYHGYLKTEIAAHGLALDLVELWGRLGGTAQISRNDRTAEGWGAYSVVSFSTATERCVESSTATAKHGYDPHFRQPYRGKVYCAEVPGHLLYVMRDGKPHWSHNSLEEINPLDVYDKQFRISRLGEGGIPSIDSVPDEARAVQPSHAAFIDPIRTPESFKAGVDVYLSSASRKGRDGRLYAPFHDVKTGQTVWKSPQDVADLAVTFPQEMARPTKRVFAFQKGRLRPVPKEQVAFTIPHFEQAFSPLANLIPMKSSVKGQRLAMGSRMLTQALPLANAEAPLVQSGLPDGSGHSYERMLGGRMGALRAKQAGRVLAVTPDKITMQYADGKTEEHELFQNFPYNRKTYVHQTAMVKPGDVIQPDQLLARSNYTSDTGETALGRNARVAYIPFRGMNFEDAVVISESMADKLSSEHMYQHRADFDQESKRSRKEFLGLFPGRYSRKQLDTIDDDGAIRVGTPVQFGDPLVLAAGPRQEGQHKVHRAKSERFDDKSLTWEHHSPGIVTDVVKHKTGTTVLVKSLSPTQVGDKLANRYGGKGIVSAIIPDNEMPTNKTGEPFELLLNPLGIISRTNPAQVVETALGKIAAKTGKPIIVPDFENIEDMRDFAQKELRKHGLSDTEDLVDAETGRALKSILTGHQFFMKLHHTAEGKGQGRGTGAYTMDDQPAKGGEHGSKRISLMDTNALLSHGATGVLQDASAVRGQRNEDYWLAFMQGHTPPKPKVPLVFQKFVNELKAAGINVVPSGGKLNIMALTDKDVDQLAGDREITAGDTVDFGKNLTPIKGGLFDPTLTGGHHGNRWGFIRLAEPMPNPVMEEPIRRVLGLTQKKFEAVLAGKEPLGGETGPEAIQKALARINVPREITRARVEMQQGKATVRDAAVRRLGYLKSAERLKMHPQDWMVTKAPVLPPMFRPLSVMADSDIPLVSDANYLYKELLDANTLLKDLKKDVDDVGEERLGVYNAFKAVTGLADPVHPKLQEKNVSGILKHIFGSSPKFGTVQRRLLSSPVDLVGRAVISPNPDLDMDHVGLPENRAWDVYRNFIVRRLKRQGLSISQALEAVENRTPAARQQLLAEMEHRPVFINRAPVLHRFGVMAFWPKLVKGETLQVSPLTVTGFNADFDGDAMQYHLPGTDRAREEAIDLMLPSRNLISPADFKTPMYAPGQEYVGGIYAATQKPDETKPRRFFKSRQDAIQAYRRGELDVNAPIQIMS